MIEGDSFNLAGRDRLEIETPNGAIDTIDNRYQNMVYWGL